MTQDPRHSDNFARGDAPASETVSEAARAAGRTIDNAATAAAAERQRTFTEGDDGGAPRPPAPPAASAPSLVAAATARIRGTERPSPFGVAQFPPLPVPPGIARSRP